MHRDSLNLIRQTAGQIIEHIERLPGDHSHALAAVRALHRDALDIIEGRWAPPISEIAPAIEDRIMLVLRRTQRAAELQPDMRALRAILLAFCPNHPGRINLHDHD
jgi:hypothetical protein